MKRTDERKMNFELKERPIAFDVLEKKDWTVWKSVHD